MIMYIYMGIQVIYEKTIETGKQSEISQECLGLKNRVKQR